MDDARVVWIRDVVCDHLDISPLEQDEIFETFLLSDDGRPEFILNKFLSGQTADETFTLAFYKELREEEEWVEVPIESGKESDIPEEEEAEEDEVVTETVEPVPIDDDTKAKKAKRNNKNKKKGKKNKNKVLKSKTAETKGDSQQKKANTRKGKPLGKPNNPLQDDKKLKNNETKQIGEPSNPETIKPLDKLTNELESSKTSLEPSAKPENQEDEEEEDAGTLLILRKIMKPYLFVVETQDLPKDAVNRDFLFMVRRLDGIVPETVGKHEDLNEVLTRHFETLMMNGDFLRSMNQIITEIYMPLLSFNDQKNLHSDVGGVAPGGVIHGKPSVSTEFDKKTSLRSASPSQGRTSVRPPRLTKQSSGSGILGSTRRPITPVSAEEATARKPSSFPASTLSDVTAADTGQSRLTYAQKMIRDELMIHLQKFNLAVRTTMTQLEGEVHLEVPSGLTFSSSLKENVRNRSLMAKVEETCHNWFQQVGILESPPSSHSRLT